LLLFVFVGASVVFLLFVFVGARVTPVLFVFVGIRDVQTQQPHRWCSC
jgi:hypothetical protein